MLHTDSLWTEASHVCPFDLKRRFARNTDIRDCLTGTAHPPDEMRRSAYGARLGFLYDIRKCQEGLFWPVWKEYYDAVQHNGTIDCPRGCGKVRLESLNMPESDRECLEGAFGDFNGVPWVLREHP